MEATAQTSDGGQQALEARTIESGSGGESSSGCSSNSGTGGSNSDGSGPTPFPAPHPSLFTPDSKLMKHRPKKVCVFGSGSFGTAMGTHLARQGHEVWILTRKIEICTAITTSHRHPYTMSEFTLPYNITATLDPSLALAHADFILHAIPVQCSFEYLAALKDLIPPGIPFINTSKGLHTERLQMMSELVACALGRPQPFAVISGPTFAQELMMGFPTGAVAASTDPAVASAVAQLFSSHVFRTFTSADVVGVELAGGLKNCYALAAGCLEGLGLGFNTTALLVTRAVAEMNRLAKVLGSTEATLAGLAGVGDMMITCFGRASRNRTVGVRLGKGEKLKDIMASMTEVAEGVATAPAALALARRSGVPAPILEAVVGVLEGAIAPMTGLMLLLNFPVGEEKIM